MNQIAIHTLNKAALRTFRVPSPMVGKFPMVSGRLFANGKKKELTMSQKEIIPEIEAM